MFLSQLNKENKELFLNLCGHAVMADNVVEPEEMEYLALCCHEMDIPNQLPDISTSLDEVLSEIAKTATAYEKNVMLFELMLLFKYDGSYDIEEKLFLKTVVEKLDITNEKLDEMAKMASKYIRIYNDICDLLNV